MKIKAERILGINLKPGDLFSTAGPDYWGNIDPGSIGERVYIRMDSPAEWAPDYDGYVYKITIEKEKQTILMQFASAGANERVPILLWIQRW